jgi:hypothetical protein
LRNHQQKNLLLKNRLPRNLPLRNHLRKNLHHQKNPLQLLKKQLQSL